MELNNLITTMKKLLSHLKLLLFIGAFIIVFTGCKDEENGGSPEVNNLLGTWTVDNVDISAMVGGQSLTDWFINVGGLSAENAAIAYAIFETFLLAEVSGSITFKDDNTYVSSFGGSPDDGTWSLSSDGKTLTLDAGTVDEVQINVISLTNSTAHMVFAQQILEDLDDDPLTPDVPIDVEADMTLSK